MATAEVQEQRVPTDQECFDFVPPPCFPGMPVAFYREGRVNPKFAPEVGWVLKVPSARKTAVLYLPASGQTVSDVRHVSDPRLIRHPEVRNSGTWDYTPADSAAAERAALTEKRLAALEAKETNLAAIESRLHSLSIKFGKLAKEVGSIEE